MDLQSAGGTARQAPTSTGRLSTDARLGGGRYTVGRLVRRGPLTETYEAVDATTQSPVNLHLLDARLGQDAEVMAAVAEDVRAARGVSHASLAGVIELAIEGQHAYLVTELADGHSLRELLARKRETAATGFGVKGAVNIAMHLASALTAAHEAVAHGGVSLDSVVVSRSGRVKLVDLGLAAAMPLAARLGMTGPACAPEVVAGARPSAAADTFSVGAVLYELLVGKPPVKGCVRPSEAIPGLPAAVDQLIATCMAQNPAQRPKKVMDVRDALTAALAERVSGAQPAQAAPAQAAPVQPSPAQAAAPSLAESLAATISSPSPARTSAPMPAPSAQLTAALSETDERWLISKGKLDYGPFTLAQVVEQIQGNQILPGNILVDKDTGDRRKVEDHPLLSELVDAARLRRDEARRTEAEVVHAKQEKRRGAALYGFIALAVVGLGGGAYLLWSTLASHKDDGNSGAIAGLESGKVEATLSFPSKEERKKRRAAGRHSGGGKAGGVAGGWDDTVNLDMDEDGGDERLDDSQVNPVLQRSGGALGHCLTSTGSHKANIEFIVKGTGKVSQVRVNGETKSGLANCVRGVMKSMQFPTFDGQRSKHYFDMAY
jgi:serine/threonine protein kinase